MNGKQRSIATPGEFGVRVMLIFGLVFSGISPASAQTKAAKLKAPATKVSPQTAKENEFAAPGGTREGIKVHGDWTIIIRNADGTVAARHEFKNALVSHGVLPRLLAHGGSAGPWLVNIFGQGGGPCLDSAGRPSACELRETGGTPAFGTLQVSAPAAGPDADILVLKGSVQAVNAAQIQLVRTRLLICVPLEAPSPTCSFNADVIVTEKDVTSNNIQVNAGQTIDVVVRISFS